MRSTQTQVTLIDLEPDVETFRTAVLRGMSMPHKAIPPKFLYDQRGSALFDRICRLPEYYPTRTEMALLRAHRRDIAALAGTGCQLVEFGSGSSEKIRILLDVLRQPAQYVAVDISGQHLLSAAERLADDYPDIDVVALCADYTRFLPLPPAADGRRLGFFPGSTIGNFTPAEAVDFLKSAHRSLGSGAFIVGVDLKKEPAILHAAYNDAQGVTEAFTVNLLRRMNRELDGDFDATAFSYVAFYNEEAGRIEIHLESRFGQTVSVAGEAFALARDERIHVEYSYKYDVEEFHQMAARAGFRSRETWVDADGLFSVHYLVGA